MDTKEIISGFEPGKENLINILHAIQNNNLSNYLTVDDLKLVAEYLNITYAFVYGVVKYYSMFSLKPRGKYLIRVCKSPLCHMVDGNKLVKEIKNNLGIEIGETTNDNLFSVEFSECLGHCAEAPVMMINDMVYSGLNSSRVQEIFQGIMNNEKNI